jgi:hypothetical protein
VNGPWIRKTLWITHGALPRKRPPSAQSLHEAGYEIVHPLTTEPWGVVRFLVRTPDGTVLNIVQHHT